MVRSCGQRGAKQVVKLTAYIMKPHGEGARRLTFGTDIPERKQNATVRAPHQGKCVVRMENQRLRGSTATVSSLRGFKGCPAPAGKDPNFRNVLHGLTRPGGLGEGEKTEIENATRIRHVVMIRSPPGSPAAFHLIVGCVPQAHRLPDTQPTPCPHTHSPELETAKPPPTSLHNQRAITDSFHRRLPAAGKITGPPAPYPQRLFQHPLPSRGLASEEGLRRAGRKWVGDESLRGKPRPWARCVLQGKLLLLQHPRPLTWCFSQTGNQMSAE
ncbi:uncharacterized protein LOC129624704 isoform X2 [Bubalus kerabau]|uniref:uncharacterized protein LOC129624704 isoform X2 n=1 Tax=Bubalus carabanensis TaxID=3119969 RepID=UPI00244EBDDF|nr:uncharacterized protein LOC129624704 isoform X2 [Bubalus carabanensis]XP_055398875.1 uncharacterized protein LOC129624704 isoform X2 [Bubalus carabanensis]